MKRLSIAAAVATVMTGALFAGTPALAHHVEYLDVPFDSRGECEAMSARLSAGDKDYLQEIGPQYFGTAGDVESFLTRAFSCELSESDGEWYITDHRLEVLESDWFAQRKH